LKLALINLGAMTAAYVPCPFPYFPIPYGCYCGITITPPPQPPIDIFDQECKDHDQVFFLYSTWLPFGLFSKYIPLLPFW